MYPFCSQVMYLTQEGPGSGLSWALRPSLSISRPRVCPEVLSGARRAAEALEGPGPGEGKSPACPVDHTLSSVSRASCLTFLTRLVAEFGGPTPVPLWSVNQAPHPTLCLLSSDRRKDGVGVSEECDCGDTVCPGC